MGVHRGMRIAQHVCPQQVPVGATVALVRRSPFPAGLHCRGGASGLQHPRPGLFQRGWATMPRETPPEETLPRPALVRSSLCPHGRRTMDFARGWAWQHFLLHRRLAHRRHHRTHNAQGSVEGNQEHVHGDSDTDVILLLEHAPVYTLGRGADEAFLSFLWETTSHEDRQELRRRLARTARGPDAARLVLDRTHHAVLWESHDSQPDTNHCSTTTTTTIQCIDSLARLGRNPVLAPNGAPLYRVERGGQVTFHGPGQLVVYPLLDLQQNPLQPDLKWYLHSIEQVIIDTLGEFDVQGVRDRINTGVWVDGCKVAAVGVSASRWITTHGFALNVSVDLDYFDTSIIIPCGIEGRGVTSLQEILQRRGETKVPSVLQVSEIVLDKLHKVFGIRLEHGEELL